MNRNQLQINWRYAIGEIIIVIIGISIAFSLNRWAQNAQSQQTKILYLDNLRSELQTDQDQMDQNIQSMERKMGLIKQLMPHIGRELQGRDTIYRSFFELANQVSFIPTDASFQTLIHSGDLKLFSDLKLKSALIGYYDNYKNLKREYERHDNFSRTYLAEFFMKNLDYNLMRQGDFSFLDDPIMPNMIQSLQGILILKLEATKRTKDECEQLVQLLDSYAKK